MPAMPRGSRAAICLMAALSMYTCADAVDVERPDGRPVAGDDGSRPEPDFSVPIARYDAGELPPDRADVGPAGGCDPAAPPPALADAPRCHDHDDCGPGYECRRVENFGPDITYVCVPPICIDRDGDGHGIGEACDGIDCDDCDRAVYDGAPEVCNGRDDDCDGALDEQIDPATMPADACGGLGVCVGDAWRCTRAEWVCARPPTYEADETRCDGLDNDCDGMIDEVPGRGDRCEAGAGPCRQPGVMRCDGLTGGLVCDATPLPPVDEICNGLDDDCDGVVDNVPGVGEACEITSGSCVSDGERRCDPVRGRVVCDAPAPMPRDEVCDRRDNDCDGAVDEDACGPVGPGEEECNNADDDLDGRIDEALSRVCRGACGPGEERCVAGRWTPCDAPVGEPEVCNGADDDCDGAVDERVENACGGCGEVPAERCGNGIDDDCDGQADEACAVGPCIGRPDGTPAGECERWGLCGGFVDVCDSTGTEEWRCPVCQGGDEGGERIEMRMCRQDTEGVICEVGGRQGSCRGDRCVCDAPTRLSCEGDVRVEDGCDGVRRTRCQYGCRGGECGVCVPRWSAPRCEGGVVVRDDGCGEEDRDPCSANERCEGGQCVVDCEVRRECFNEDVYEVDTCEGRGPKLEECNGIGGLRDSGDMCDAGRCCYACRLGESRWPRADERVSHNSPNFPNDGRAMRLELARNGINPANTCGDFTLVVTKIDGTPFGAGQYHLRLGACLPQAVVRSRNSPYTFALRGGEREVLLRPIDLRVEDAWPDPSFDRFCVTKDDGGNVAWWHSNLLTIDRVQVACR